MTQTATTQTKRPQGMGLLIATSLTLFSMFFGAGNLIFPPIMGANSGSNFNPAMIGFLIGGVALPVIAIIAIALSGTDLRDLSGRGGKAFGITFSCMVYLSIGAFYALPRTGAVSFSTAIAPIIHSTSFVSSMIFNALFFGLALFLSWNPRQIVNHLGKILTPVLLVLLVLLVFLSLAKLPPSEVAPVGQYVHAPLTAGLLDGYMTMDSIAALAFGIIVVASFDQGEGGISGAKLIRRTSAAGLIAGILLGLVYVGLGLIGHVIPGGQNYTDGAALLADASHITMGTAGQLVFGLIVLTACMTTAVGLLAATSEFFERLLPKITYKMWLVGFTIISFVLASFGLSTVLKVAVPIITFLYPIAISIVFITILTHPLHYSMQVRWTFRLGVWVASIWSLLTTVISFGTLDFIAPLMAWSPGQDLQIGWILPTVVAALIGFVIDLLFSKRTHV